MIDNVKFTFDDKASIDKFVRDIRRKATVRKARNGEGETYTLYIHNLKIVSPPKGDTYLEGSLHSFFNAIHGKTSKHKKHKWVNHNDFTYNDLCGVIKELEKRIRYDFSKTKLTICEFGFNIELDMPADEFIDEYILMYKFRAPCYDPKYINEMKIKKFDLENYYIKVYDKALQYGLDKHLLRYETGFKTDELRACNIISLKDLLDEDTLKSLYNEQYKKYDNLLIVDSYDGIKSMVKRDRRKMINYTNPHFWIRLLKAKDYDERRKHKKELNSLIFNNGLDSRKRYLIERIYQKLNYLLYKDTI